MIKPKYLSPSSLALYKQSPKDFYLRYLSSYFKREYRPPQTLPMSIGSAFDAFIKSYLYEAIFGKNDSKFEKQVLFEAQVEEQNRSLAFDIGEYLLAIYKASGALADMMLDLNQAIDKPRFELEIGAVIINPKNLMGVPLLGKPDIWFINSSGNHVIWDWKVNGYCSKYNKSPLAGYTKLRGETGYNYGEHKDHIPLIFNGMLINASYLETYEPSWALQLATYGWLMGESVGKEIIIGVDQIVCNGTKSKLINGVQRPEIRIASHRARVSNRFQLEIINEYQELWSIINSDYFFRDLSYEDSKSKCEMLDLMAQQMASSNELDSWINTISREQS